MFKYHNVNMPANFIIIDGSYYCFYRYYALTQWWSLAKPDDNLGIPIENPDFVEKFKATFISKVKEIAKKLKIDNPIMIVGKDCPRKNIWRMELTETYKENRDKDDTFLGGPFFKMAYDSLWEEAGINAIVKFPHLEADDCIALTIERIRESVDNAKIWLIASDMDYLQLLDDDLKIFNLKYKDISTSKNATGNAECDLFCKIVTGDKSDDIPGVFAKCGPKTAMSYYNDRENFNKKLAKDPDAKARFEKNTKLIDFRCIPDYLRTGFRRQVLGCD